MLECIVSMDIKGAVLQPNVGLVGAAFKRKAIVNVSDNDASPSGSFHSSNGDMQDFFSFQAKNILCSPVLTDSGEAIGVIQVRYRHSSPASWVFSLTFFASLSSDIDMC